MLRRGRRLGEAHPEISREEQGVVAEPACAARLREHAAFGRRLDELRGGRGRLEKGCDTAITRRAPLLRDAREPLQQQRVVRRVEPPFPPPPPRFPVQVRVPRRVNTRRALERVHLEPRVLGHGGEPAPLGEVARLGDGVLGEAHPLLQVALLGETLQELVPREHQLKRQPREQLADLPRLAVIAGGDQQLHRGGRRRRSSSAVVDWPGTSATRTTRPPHPSTSSAPTIASRGESAPFTSTSGRSRRTSASGGASSNSTTQSTQASAASSRARSPSGTKGRSGPFTRRTEASVFRPTTSASPSARAASSRLTCPACSRSNTPFVNTTGPRWRARHSAAASSGRTFAAVFRRGGASSATRYIGCVTLGWSVKVWWKSGRSTVSLYRSEEHTSELQSLAYLVCRLLLEKKNNL